MTTVTTRPRSYQYRNQFITRSLITELEESMKYLRMDDVIGYMENMGCPNNTAYQPNGNPVVMADLGAMLGDNVFAKSVGPIWFYGGPEETPSSNTNRFVLVQGTALSWCMDSILYRVSVKGPSVFAKVGIPL